MLAFVPKMKAKVLNFHQSVEGGLGTRVHSNHHVCHYIQRAISLSPSK